MQDKVVVITGATSGLGQAAAEALAKLGARIVLAARDANRAQATLAALNAAGPGHAHRAVLGDLSTLAEMRRVGAEIAASEPKIDVLANNAGAVFMRREETEDGLERTFAVNHMAYFVLTNALMPSLMAAPAARIVQTASDAHQIGAIDFNDLQMQRGWSTFAAYGNSKLCNILHTRELARRLSGTNVTANCFHPGFVASRLGSNNGALAKLAIKLISPLADAPTKAARTLTYLASSPDVAHANGRYFIRSKEAKPARAALDDAAAARLWAESEKIAGV